MTEGISNAERAYLQYRKPLKTKTKIILAFMPKPVELPDNRYIIKLIKDNKKKLRKI